MRLHALRLRAFGPFADEQAIDFEPLGAGGLFLLDGPTGAGKSTVLDAITFALYGPGEGGGWGRLHSHFAAGGVRPEVCLEFSVRGERQRVTRSPEHRRPKRRGGGTTVEKAQVHLERWQDGRWLSRSSRKDEVGEMLADDIGLRRDQFTQVVVLPQGEFMRFLQATDDERRALLTKLFGAHLYDRITDELDRRRQGAARSLDAARAAVGAQLGALAQAAGLDNAERHELAAHGPAQLADALDAVHQRLAALARAADAARAAADAELARLRPVAEAATAESDRLRRFATAAAAHRAHEASREHHDEAGAVLAAATRAEPVRARLADVDDAAHAVARVGRGVPVEHAGADPAQLRAEAADVVRTAAGLAHALGREGELGRLAALAAAAGEGVVEAADVAGRLAGRAHTLPGELELAAGALARAREARAGLPGLVARTADAAARAGAALGLAGLRPLRDAAQQRRESAFAAYEDAAARHRELAEQRLANMAAELAGELADGRPCAVCGATEHPVPATPRPGSADAAAVALADDERARAQQAHDAARDAVAELAQQWATLAERAGPDPDPARLAAERDRAVAAEQGARAAAETVDPTLATHEQLVTEAQTLAERRGEAEAALAAARSAADDASAALAGAHAELADARAGFATVAARQRELEARAARLAGLADAVDVVRTAEANLATATGRAAATAAEQGFADPSAARAALLPAPDRSAMQELVDRWHARAHELRGALTTPEFAGLEPGEAGDRSATAEAACGVAREALAHATSSAEAAALRAHAAAATLAGYVHARQRLDEVGEACRLLTADAEPVVHLANLAKGVAGQRRVRLTSYVLRQWFEQVVGAANVRLSGMSGGRYELVRVDEGASRAERAGLTIEVLDLHTGEQRSARSLSGGETFYASLALALGLADVVRAEAGGVDLDTLFIDEGFGSLDADTLDQVMGVIDELRERGRTVGIVSHVAELKNRITERIEVRRRPDGSSTVQVVA